MDGPLTVASFDELQVRDAALRPLMQKIKVTTDLEIEALVPHTMMVRAIVRTIDGTAHEVEIVNPLGHPDNPMGDADIENKFRAQSEPAIGAARCDEVLEAWWRLSDAAELRPLIEMLDI